MVALHSMPCADELIAGKAIFPADMQVWWSKYGEDVWRLLDPQSPLSSGESTNAIVWSDFMHGRGATFGHPNSMQRSRYALCLTPQMVLDLKIAAVIHGYFPSLVKNARVAKAIVDAKTVKGRIEDLARLFSAVMVEAKERGIVLTHLQDIPFSLLKETIARHPGRGDHLKRALKLISSPVVQKNLSGPLQWKFVDIQKGTVPWPKSEDGTGIDTLPDAYFLSIQDYCIASIRNLKMILGIPVHCHEKGASAEGPMAIPAGWRKAVEEYLAENPQGEEMRLEFEQRFGYRARSIEECIVDAQCAAIMVILLFTGMRRTETSFLLNGSLTYKHGYWFLNSKVLKQRKKDIPICEGWLAIDLVRDAYDILSMFCQYSKNKYLFSSPFARFSVDHRGYAPNAISIKLSRWLKKIDVNEKFSNWKFSPHQCRETLVAQLALQEVKLPFISMQLKHFHSRFHSMPNEVTAGYGKYRAQLMKSVSNRLPQARAFMLNDLYGEDAKFAGGGGEAHKARIDTFFVGMGLFGVGRQRYLERMAQRGARTQPTSIGSCTHNFQMPVEDESPPCYGDYDCDPDCESHVITQRGALALKSRRTHALAEAHNETVGAYKVVWMGLADKLGRHEAKLEMQDDHER